MPLDPILAMVLEKAPPLVAPEVAHDAAAAREDRKSVV